MVMVCRCDAVRAAPVRHGQEQELDGSGWGFGEAGFCEEQSPDVKHQASSSLDAYVQRAVEVLEPLPPEAVVQAVELLASKNPDLLDLLVELSKSPLHSDTGVNTDAVECRSISCRVLDVETACPPPALPEKALLDLPARCLKVQDENSISLNGVPGIKLLRSETSNSQRDEDSLSGVRVSQLAPEDKPNACILQFSTAIYYAKEGEDTEMVVDVTRLGSDQEACSCHYQTQDASAKAGERYRATQGELRFEPGEVLKQISVPILDKKCWCATLEFKVVLSDPRNTLLGKYLHTCRVKVIDKDCFPSNRFEESIRRNDFDSVPMFKLLFEYWKMNLLNPVVRRGTIRMVCGDQAGNLYFIWKLLIIKSIVDEVIGGLCEDAILYTIPCPEERSEKGTILVFLMVAMILPNIMVHMFDYNRVFWKVGGVSRKTVQSNLVRKFLNYDESSRAQLQPSDLIMGISRDAMDLVRSGFLPLFPLLMNIGRLLMLVALQILMGSSYAIIPVAVFPVVFLSFLAVRNVKSARVATEQDKAQNELVNYVSFIVNSQRMICDYLKRDDEVEKCDQKIGSFNKKMVSADAVAVNNRYLAPWLSVAVIGMWLVIGGEQVLSGDSTLGEFLTNLDIFREVGQSWSTIYGIMLEMQGALPTLQRVVRYMNLPIDTEKRMRLNRRRRAEGEKLRMETRKKAAAQGVFAADLMPIKLEGIEYKLEGSESELWNNLTGDHKLAGSRKPLLQNCSFEFEQGTFIALVGLPGQGKSTLLKVLGGALLPSDGKLLIPPHLRVLHISQDVVFFQGSLMDNLTYGVSKDDPDGNPERVMAICNRLGVKEKLVGFLDPSNKQAFEHKADWLNVLSLTQRVLIHLARALVANPEVLVIHKPTLVFDDKQAESTFGVLQEYVQQKGLAMDPKMFAYRRPRTCVVTTGRPKGVKSADKVFSVSPGGVVAKESDDITQAEML